MLLNKALKISSIAFALGLTSIQINAQEQITGDFYNQTFFGNEIRGSGVGNGVLLDDDLIRGNSSGEAVITVEDASPGEPSPFEFFNFNTTERLMTIIFNDDTSIEDVEGIYDIARFNFGTSTAFYLPNAAALSNAGKSLNDISEIILGEVVDHNLSWSDLGFSNGGITEAPTPEPEPAINIIVGDDSNNRLVGTDGADILDGEGGSVDRLTGGLGNDSFVVGADADDFVRNYDLVLDFDVAEDTLILEAGATIQRAVNTSTYLVIVLTGSDRDIIGLRGVSDDISSINIEYLAVPFAN